MRNERFRYVHALIRQVQGFFWYLLASSLVRGLSKLSGCGLLIVSILLLRSGLDGSQPLFPAAWSVPVMIVLHIGSSYADTYVSHNMSFRILGRLRARLYQKIDELAPGGTEGSATADLVTAVASDVNVFEWFYAHVLVEWAGTILAVLPLLIWLAILSPAAAGAAVVAAVLMAVIPRFSTHQAEDKGYRLKMLFGRINSLVFDGVQGAKDIIGYGQEAAFLAEVQHSTEEYAQTQLQYSLRSGAERQVIGLLVEIGCIAACLAGIFVSTGGLSTFLLSLALSTSILGCIQGTLSEGTNYGFVFGAAKRVFGVLQRQAPVEDTGDLTASEIEGGQGVRITFENVSFHYPSRREHSALQEVTFALEPSEITAIVASSGGGKSTIARLLQRYWDVDQGRITVGGVDICDLQLCALRELVTVVPQEMYLFHGTVKDNLRLAKPKASEAELRQAARQARADLFISQLEHGYQTMVGENGALLSGGEKQRLALAQAFLRDTPILILDEASSALDALNETEINCVLAERKQGHTTVVIAHRLSTIMSADRIIYLEDGHVDQIGTYQELLDSNASFRELIQEGT